MELDTKIKILYVTVLVILGVGSYVANIMGKKSIQSQSMEAKK